MRSYRKYFKIAAVLCMAAAVCMTGCEKKEADQAAEPEVAAAKADEKTEGLPEDESIVDGRDNVEVNGNMDGLCYTSEDGKIRITLPNASWVCDSDTEESVSFSSEEGLLSIIRMEGSDAVKASIYHSADEYVSYLKGTTPTLEGEVVSFEDVTVDGHDAFRAVYHYMGSNEFRYAVSYGISFNEYCYTVNARILPEDEGLLQSVCDSVNQCEIME